MFGSVSKTTQDRSIRRLRAGTLAMFCSYVALAAIGGMARAQVFTVETDKIESRYTDISVPMSH